MSCLLLIFLLSINSFAAIVSDNDGSAFITKAEFDALKSSFQSQIDTYNQSIDSKIDGAIASYLAGIKLSNTVTQAPLGSAFSVFPLVNVKSLPDLWGKIISNVYIGLNFVCGWNSTDDSSQKGCSLARYYSQARPGDIYLPIVNTRTKNATLYLDTSVLPSITISTAETNGANSWVSLTKNDHSNYFKSGIISFGPVNDYTLVGTGPNDMKEACKLYKTVAQEGINTATRKINLYNWFSPALYTYNTGKTDYDGKYYVDYKKIRLKTEGTDGCTYYKYDGSAGVNNTLLGTSGDDAGRQFCWSNWQSTTAAAAADYAKFPTRYGPSTSVITPATSKSGTKYLSYIHPHTQSWTLRSKPWYSRWTLEYPTVTHNCNNWQLWCSPYGAPIPVLATDQNMHTVLAAVDDFEKWDTVDELVAQFTQKVDFQSTNTTYGVGNLSKLCIVPYHPWVQETGLGWCGDMYEKDFAVDSKYINYKVNQQVDGSDQIPASSGWPLLAAAKNGKVEFTITWDKTLPTRYATAQSKTQNKIKVYVTSGAPNSTTGKRTVVPTCKVKGTSASSQPWQTDTTLDVSFDAEAGKTYYLYWETDDTYFGANITNVSDLTQTVED